jgi:hypothetical protein
MKNVTVLRLKNGDTLIAGVRTTEEGEMLWLDDPIAVIPVPVVQGGVNGETFLLKPWIGIAEDKSFLLSVREVLTTGTLKDHLLEQYKMYVGHDPIAAEPEEEYDELEMLQARILRSRNLLN